MLTVRMALLALVSGAASAHQVFVTNEISGDLTVLEGGTHRMLATVPLGKRPRGIQSSPDGRLLYIALSGTPISPPGTDERTLPPADKKADGIGVYEVATRRLQRVIRGVSDPEQLAVSRDGKRLFIASEDTGTAVVLDATSGAVLATLPVGGEPEGVAISPDGRIVYVTSEEDHRVSAIDTAELRVVGQFEVGKRPRAAAFTSDSARAYVTGENDASLSVIDARSHRPLHRIQLAGENPRPMGVVISPDDRIVYVATGRGGHVVAIDASTRQILRQAKAGARPWGVALSPDGRRLYSANGPSNDVSVIDTATMKVVATVRAGERPWGVLTLPR